MRPLTGLVWGCALAALTAGAGSARAGWNNVFQVCCHKCRSAPAPVAAYYAAPAPVAAAYADPCCPAPCPAPCPQTTCTTRYVQRCYYQPVTCYRTSTYYQPVTTYRTSYYYEPVCTYRYSCYYDPCTCSYQQVATPVTSYRLRSQCCPVTSYLQRTCLQPVTSYRQVTYYEPVTTCCTTTPGAPVCAPPAGAAVVPPARRAASAQPQTGTRTGLMARSPQSRRVVGWASSAPGVHWSAPRNLSFDSAHPFNAGTLFHDWKRGYLLQDDGPRREPKSGGGGGKVDRSGKIDRPAAGKAAGPGTFG